MSLADALITVIDQRNYARVPIINPRSGASQPLTEAPISAAGAPLESGSHAMPFFMLE
jgi:hypothetical protein